MRARTYPHLTQEEKEQIRQEVDNRPENRRMRRLMLAAIYIQVAAWIILPIMYLIAAVTGRGM